MIILIIIMMIITTLILALFMLMLALVLLIILVRVYGQLIRVDPMLQRVCDTNLQYMILYCNMVQQSLVCYILQYGILDYSILEIRCYIYIYIHTHIYLYIYIYIYIHTCVINTHVHMYMYIYIYYVSSVWSAVRGGPLARASRLEHQGPFGS